MENLPEPGVGYAAFPTEEYRTARSLEAVRSLAKSWGVTESRAAVCLRDPAEYAAEYRSRQPLTTVQALRHLAARTAGPQCWCGCR